MQRYFLKTGFIVSVVALLLWGCTNEEADPRAKDIDARLARLKSVPMKFDARDLPLRKKELLKALVEAGQLLHEAYLYQFSPEGVAIRDSLMRLEDELSKKVLRLVERNGGPYDRMDGFKNFVNGTPKPPGAGFYPVDLNRDELEGYLARYMSKAKSLISPYTVVRRDNGGLVAVPYHKEYAKFVVPAAGLVRKASTLTDNESLKKFLEQRADALLTDDYHQSHLDWLDVKDTDIDLVMAPDEVSDDALMGTKASYEVSVMIKDSAASAKLDIFARYLHDLEHHLPMEEKYKRSVVKLSSPMLVVVDIYRGGDIATGYQAVAATVPNDPGVRGTRGTKKIFWKNLMVARFEKIILPIGRELIASDQIEYITIQGVFSDVVMHELSHSLGPIYVYGTNDTLTVNQALKEHYTALEETKASIAGLHAMRFFVQNGLVPKEMEKVHSVSALASIFRDIRSGSTEAHAKASLCALNYFRHAGAIRYDQSTKKWSVVFGKFGSAVADLAREVLLLEATGDYRGTEKFFKRWSSKPIEVEQSLRRLDHLPVDIEPVYTVKWD